MDANVKMHKVFLRIENKSQVVQLSFPIFANFGTFW